MSKRAMLWSGCVAAVVCVGVVSTLVNAKPAEIKAEPLPSEVPVMVIPAGPDYLTTPAGKARVPVSAPAGFFFEGSDPVAVQADMVGIPIGAKPARRDGFQWVFGAPNDRNYWDHPYDTRMVRYQDAVLPEIGSQATIDLKLDVVQMEAPEPIIVTGAGEVREYLVRLDLRPFHQELAGTEKMGWMHFTRTGYGTGHFAAEFYAWARYTFTPADGNAPLVYDLDDQLTIRVRDEIPTRFYIPTLLTTSDVQAAEQEVTSGGGTTDSTSGDVECDGCCCCDTDNPQNAIAKGTHCPYY